MAGTAQQLAGSARRGPQNLIVMFHYWNEVCLQKYISQLIVILDHKMLFWSEQRAREDTLSKRGQREDLISFFLYNGFISDEVILCGML